MMTGSRTQAGFTLVELMITAVLIGILAAIAIPNFLAYQAKSRRSEAYANVVAIATSELSYQAESDVYVDAGPFPDSGPYGGLGTHKMTWDAASVAEYAPLGWSPEGEVAYSYEVNAGASPGCTCSLCFTATAHGDVDGDGTRGAVMYVYPEETPGGLTECPSGMFGYGTPLRKGSLTDKVYKEAAINYSTGDEF
jgi:type IV pilus assembly protein PilA